MAWARAIFLKVQVDYHKISQKPRIVLSNPLPFGWFLKEHPNLHDECFKPSE